MIINSGSIPALIDTDPNPQTPINPGTGFQVTAGTQYWLKAQPNGTINTTTVYTLAGLQNVIQAGAGIQPLSQLGGSSGTPGAVIPATGASSVIVLPMTNISEYTSYDLNFHCWTTSQGSLGAPLVVYVRLEWFDDLTSGIPVFAEDWWAWVANGSAITPNPYGNSNPLAACGPMHGAYMRVTMFNISATQPINVQYFNLFGSNRSVPYSDWRQNASVFSVVSQGITVNQLVQRTGYDNDLGTTTPTPIPPSSHFWYPLNLYAGPVYYRFQTTQALANDFVICSAEAMLSGGILLGTNNDETLVNLASVAGAEYEGQFNAPRAPLYAVISSGSGTAPTIDFSLIAQQAA